MMAGKPRARGSVLLLALLFVLMLSLVAASVVQTATLQLHMAGNEQFRAQAGQLAKALAGELSLYPENFELASDIGHTNCVPADPDPDCDSRGLRLPDSAAMAAGFDLDYRITRVAPLRREAYPLPGWPEDATETALPDVAIFEVEVRVDGRHSRRGAAHVVQGVARPLDASGEGAGDPGNSLYRVYWREPGPDPL